MGCNYQCGSSGESEEAFVDTAVCLPYRCEFRPDAGPEETENMDSLPCFGQEDWSDVWPELWISFLLRVL